MNEMVLEKESRFRIVFDNFFEMKEELKINVLMELELFLKIL
jgi:hypothetical protein